MKNVWKGSDLKKDIIGEVNIKMVNLEQIKLNATKMKNEGLDTKIVETAKEAYEFAKSKTTDFRGRFHTHVREYDVANILGIFGGAVKGLNIIDLGCGDNALGGKEYAPVLSTALAYLGANVRGIDFPHANEEDKKRIYDKLGFNYAHHNLIWPMKYCEEKTKEMFKDNDLIIMHSLLHNGLKMEDSGWGYHSSLEAEWNQYIKTIKEIQRFNSKDSLCYLKIPSPNQFEWEIKRIDKKDISEEEKTKEKDKYAVSRFKSAFGEIIFGEEIPGQHVFTINLH